MKSDKGKNIKITEETWRHLVKSEQELSKIQDENAGSKKFGAFVFYCLTVWGVSLDEARYAMFFAILGPSWLYIVSLLSKISDSEEYQKFFIFFAFVSIIIIGIIGATLDPNGNSESYFYVFAFSAFGTGLLPLKKSQPLKN